MSALDELRAISPRQTLSSDFIFEAIFEAGSTFGDVDREDEIALEIAIRLLEARRTQQLPESCVDAVEMLAEECGLYPYIDQSRFSLFTQSVIEAHAIELDGKLYLHSKQMQILLWLLAGDNVILSAPTSFGKSVLMDALLARTKPHTVVMMLPTIALIDETRRRLTRRFGRDYTILTTSTDRYDPNSPSIFILTQERFLKREDISSIDLLFVDEFYKLDPLRKDDRYETLNIALYRALPRSKQCFMAGPHITGIELGDRWRGNFRFVQTDYRTVTVNVLDRSSNEDRLASFLYDLRSVGQESSIVFTASPASAHALMDDVIKAGISYPSELGKSVGEWIAKNYHREWPVAKGTEAGIAVHHGRLPRALGQVFVQLFDAGLIKILICTSTLIEGVNTSAANVFIFDKKISRTDFDFFSFANIRGRVGRMMRHFVGRAFLYHEAPHEVETRVDVPVLSDPGSSTDYIVMNVDSDSLSHRGQERQQRLPISSGLSEAILREHGAIGVDLLVAVFARIKEMIAKDETQLNWSGFPTREQRIAVAELALLIAHARKDQPGLHAPKQVAWAWSMLNSIKTLPSFLRWFARTFFESDVVTGIDEAFRFLQACEFGFPRSLAAIEALTRHAKVELTPNYGVFIVGIENWFRPPWMKQLDESGIPLPLVERLRPHIGDPDGRRDALDRLHKLDVSNLKDFDKVDLFILNLALTS